MRAAGIVYRWREKPVGGVVNEYLKRLQRTIAAQVIQEQMAHGRVERLNGIILVPCSGNICLANLRTSKLRDLCLDQVLFACRVRTHITTKVFPFYFLYRKYPHLLGNVNKALPIDATPVGPKGRLCLVQSARTQGAIATHQRALYALDDMQSSRIGRGRMGLSSA
jgi:hypothetical protein